MSASIGLPQVRKVWSGQFEVCDPDLGDGPFQTSDGAVFDEARLLVRVLGQPVGLVTVPLNAGCLEAELVWRSVEQDWAARVNQELRMAGAPSLAELRSGEGCAGVDRPAWMTSAGETRVTVIVCTRNRTEDLEGCLESLQRVQHDNLEILVVDNAPSDDSTARLVSRMASSDSRLRYVREDRPGLSRARNRGAREATSEIVAYTDDDVRVDPLWVAGLLRGFDRQQDVGCVTGLVATASLEHAAEQYFDTRVWLPSNCEQRLYSAARGPRDSRLHPYAPGAFGAGSNMAFRVDAIHEIGGFDECLGAGSPTGGGEDLDAFVRVLLSGYRLSHEPVALVWHKHRVTESDLRRQMYEYGKGLSACICKWSLSRRSRRDVAVRLLFGIWHLMALMRQSEVAANQAVVGRHVLWNEVRGLVVGPWLYLSARQRQARERARGVAP